jgi:hypothetical protein
MPLNALRAVRIRLVNDYWKEQRDARVAARGSRAGRQENDSEHGALDCPQKLDPEL